MKKNNPTITRRIKKVLIFIVMFLIVAAFLFCHKNNKEVYLYEKDLKIHIYEYSYLHRVANVRIYDKTYKNGFTLFQIPSVQESKNIHIERWNTNHEVVVSFNLNCISEQRDFWSNLGYSTIREIDPRGPLLLQSSPLMTTPEARICYGEKVLFFYDINGGATVARPITFLFRPNQSLEVTFRLPSGANIHPGPK